MQDGGDGLQDRRAEGFYAQGIKPIHSLLTAPPIVPPRALQALHCNPAKSTAAAHHSRLQQRPEAQRSRPPAIQHRHRLQPQNSQPTGPQPHTAKPAATNQRARARFRPNAQAHEPKRARTRESRRARVRVGTPGGSSTSAGAEAQNIFRCV